MDVFDAIAKDIPVLYGIGDGNQTRVWCDQCFIWHWHGGPGLKVPHCPWAAGYYLVVNDLDSAAVEETYGYRFGRKWRAHCFQCMRFHQPMSLGQQLRPHRYRVIARPGPGSPVFCQASGRFFNLETAEVVDPGYSELEMTKYQYWIRAASPLPLG